MNYRRKDLDKDVVNNKFLHHYKVSLDSSSNATSNIILNNVWQIHLINDQRRHSKVLHEASISLKNSAVEEFKNWKSNLNSFSEAIVTTTIYSCHCIGDSSESNFSKFCQNDCNCNLNIIKNSIDVYSKDFKNNNSSQESNLAGEHKPLFRPKFGISKVKTKSNPEKVVVDVDIVKMEGEDRDHKMNVAKITFKTAKEQLLASNPAAKRTLGASRKAQGKFISPMLGIQEKQEPEPVVTDERLKNLDPKMVELIESEIIDKGTPIGWDDIAGLHTAKSVIQEAVVWPILRPDIFTGLRRPPKGILLFGPPGTGKTLIGKCVAAQCKATFFSISASSLTSKWLGDGEKMVRALFAVARCHQPAVIFIDEIDSLLTQRSDSEHEATRRIKTEFLVQLDGAATDEDDRLLIVGATNRPQELDEAARRRLVKRLYIPLPDSEARRQIIVNLLKNENNILNSEQVGEIASLTDGYSGADMKSLCSEAAMGPIRAVPLSQIVTIHRDKVRPVCFEDFTNALERVRPSVSQDDLGQYVKWNKTYGHGF